MVLDVVDLTRFPASCGHLVRTRTSLIVSPPNTLYSFPCSLMHRSLIIKRLSPNDLVSERTHTRTHAPHTNTWAVKYGDNSGNVERSDDGDVRTDSQNSFRMRTPPSESEWGRRTKGSRARGADGGTYIDRSQWPGRRKEEIIIIDSQTPTELNATPVTSSDTAATGR